MNQKAKVFFHPIEGSASLAISWVPGPKGAAVESKNERGVGFFSPRGELLGVVFDDVTENDAQFLDFADYRVEVKVKRGRVTHHVESRKRGNAA